MRQEIISGFGYSYDLGTGGYASFSFPTLSHTSPIVSPVTPVSGSLLKTSRRSLQTSLFPISNFLINQASSSSSDISPQLLADHHLYQTNFAVVSSPPHPSSLPVTPPQASPSPSLPPVTPSFLPSKKDPVPQHLHPANNPSSFNFAHHNSHTNPPSSSITSSIPIQSPPPSSPLSSSLHHSVRHNNNQILRAFKPATIQPGLKPFPVFRSAQIHGHPPLLPHQPRPVHHPSPLHPPIVHHQPLPQPIPPPAPQPFLKPQPLPVLPPQPQSSLFYDPFEFQQAGIKQQRNKTRINPPPQTSSLPTQRLPPPLPPTPPPPPRPPTPPPPSLSPFTPVLLQPPPGAVPLPPAAVLPDDFPEYDAVPDNLAPLIPTFIPIKRLEQQQQQQQPEEKQSENPTEFLFTANKGFGLPTSQRLKRKSRKVRFCKVKYHREGSNTP